MPEAFQEVTRAGVAISQPLPDAAAPVEVMENIIYQPDEAVTDCTYYAAANLCKRMGMEVPTVERMKLLWETKNPYEVTTAESFGILTELNLPGVVAVGFIPHGLTAKDVFPPLIAAGWHLIIGVGFIGEITEKFAAFVGDQDLIGMKIYAGHCVVPYGYDDEGIDVIVGWHGMPVTKLKWATMPAVNRPAINFPQYPTTAKQTGIAREFVMVLPYKKGESNGH